MSINYDFWHQQLSISVIVNSTLYFISPVYYYLNKKIIISILKLNKNYVSIEYYHSVIHIFYPCSLIQSVLLTLAQSHPHYPLKSELLSPVGLCSYPTTTLFDWWLILFWLVFSMKHALMWWAQILVERVNYGELHCAHIYYVLMFSCRALHFCSWRHIKHDTIIIFLC
jgi:hypothetical protein